MERYGRPERRVHCKYCDCWIQNNHFALQKHNEGNHHRNAVQLFHKNRRDRATEEHKQKVEIAKAITTAAIAAHAQLALDGDVTENPSWQVFSAEENIPRPPGRPPGPPRGKPPKRFFGTVSLEELKTQQTLQSSNTKEEEEEEAEDRNEEDEEESFEFPFPLPPTNGPNLFAEPNATWTQFDYALSAFYRSKAISASDVAKVTEEYNLHKSKAKTFQSNTEEKQEENVAIPSALPLTDVTIGEWIRVNASSGAFSGSEANLETKVQTNDIAVEKKHFEENDETEETEATKFVEDEMKNVLTSAELSQHSKCDSNIEESEKGQIVFRNVRAKRSLRRRE